MKQEPEKKKIKLNHTKQLSKYCLNKVKEAKTKKETVPKKHTSSKLHIPAVIAFSLGMFVDGTQIPTCFFSAISSGKQPKISVISFKNTCSLSQ